jgi:hypothetical protein
MILLMRLSDELRQNNYQLFLKYENVLNILIYSINSIFVSDPQRQDIKLKLNCHLQIQAAINN